MPLLPRVTPPISPGKISLPFETMNPQSVNNQLIRAMRQSRGFSAYELTVAGSEAKADFLAGFAGLSKDDTADEMKLSSALDSLLLTIIEAIDVAVSSYRDEDQRILKLIAARTFKPVLAEVLSRTVENGDIQLGELRKEAHSA